MRFFFKKKTFTLIEMLIVIVIMGILAAALVPRLQDVQGRARDTKRKVDAQSVWKAAQIYMFDQGSYPLAGGCPVNSGCNVSSYSGSNRFPNISGLVSSVPIDPVNNAFNVGANTGNYAYMYGNVYQNGKSAAFFTKLENSRDPDRCEIKGYHRYNGTISNGTIFGCQSSVACAGGLTGCYNTCRGGMGCTQYYIVSDMGDYN